ncbi:NADPH:quinone reductase [Planomonospora sphaerica]|uniref:NADPH:quinone reductase n=1 Tax=Planomonospora sphaerica TaxID=161355 RepID=A0A161LP48_9ACTN|nr:NAD(P)-dependent alcohol dehydrogenase [Planomonospora sphaerica]GAT69685.1 NADPH:quinone reductase [Planomonospora sphaerica]
MRAVVRDRYGSPDVLRLEEIGRPVAGDDEVLVRVRAAAVNSADCKLMRGEPSLVRLMGYGVFKPKQRILGRDFAGRVEAVGRNVGNFRPGDEVFGETAGGAFAEYVSVREGALGPKPENLTFEQAAAVPLAGSTALQGLRDRGGVRPGQRVLVNGASGGVGTFAVQIAKALGAEVTGVCSARNAELVRSLGADRVVDYATEDFTRSGRRYDLVLDVAGSRSLRALRSVLDPGGTLVLCSGEGGRRIGPMGHIVGALALSLFVGQSLRPLAAKTTAESLAALRELVESGKVVPAVDRTYPLSEAPEAMRYLEEEHARAKIVITV